MTINELSPPAGIDAAELRRRLIRTAYALHFSASHTAKMFEENAELIPRPSLLDGLVSAKRWHQLSERALEIARACDRRGASRDGSDPAMQPDGPCDASGHLDVAALADLATRHLSAAAMTVEAMLPFVDLDQRGRLDGAVDQIDATITDLRR